MLVSARAAFRRHARIRTIGTTVARAAVVDARGPGRRGERHEENGEPPPGRHRGVSRGAVRGEQGRSEGERSGLAVEVVELGVSRPVGVEQRQPALVRLLEEAREG